MVVNESLERSALHRVLEVSRRIEGGDPRGELRDSEVTPMPCDLFTQFD
jgi:hypothetical protein